MDALAFRLGNRLLGNEDNAAGLELTVSGPTLRFNRDTVIALTGAAMTADLDGEAARFLVQPYGQGRQHIATGRSAGQRLSRVSGGGWRL